MFNWKDTQLLLHLYYLFSFDIEFVFFLLTKPIPINKQLLIPVFQAHSLEFFAGEQLSGKENVA